MLNPDRREPFAGMPPQDLRHDLSELRKGIFRIQAAETPFSSVRRFHEARRKQGVAEDLLRDWRAGSSGSGPLGDIVGWLIEKDFEATLKDLSREAEMGPRLRREIVLFDTLPLPFPSARRPNRSETRMYNQLREIAQSEADELTNRFPDGQIPEAIYDAVLHDEEVVKDLTIGR